MNNTNAFQEVQPDADLPGLTQNLLSAVQTGAPLGIALAVAALGVFLWKKFGPKKPVAVETANPKIDTSEAEKILNGGKDAK